MTKEELCILLKEWEPTDTYIKAMESRIIKLENLFEIKERENRINVERRKNDYYNI